MDYGGVLRRAWRITWDHKYLWWLGFLTALARGGGGRIGRVLNRVSDVCCGGTDGGLPTSPALDSVSDSSLLLIGTALTCLGLLVALAVWVVSTIARGSLISATNQIEDTDLSSFRQGWQAGVSNMWRMLGIGLVQAAPGLISLIAVSVLTVAALSAADVADMPDDPAALLATTGTALVCLVPLVCITVLASLALAILRPFADRACVMEGEPVFAAYRRGWTVLRDNFTDSLVLGTIRFFINMFAGSIVTVPFLLLMGSVLFGAMASQTAAGSAGGLGVTTTFIIMMLCGLLAFILVASTVGAVTTTFSSSMWTLAYRQFTGTQPQLDLGSTDEPLPA